MKKDITLIATFFSVEPFTPAAMKYLASKIILIVAASEDKNTNEKLNRNIAEVRRFFGKMSQVDVVKMESDDILDIAKKTVEIIDEEPKDVGIVVNLSGGWRSLTNGVLYACYSRTERIEKIVTNRVDRTSLSELPKLQYNLGSTKHELLKRIAVKEHKSVSKLADDMKKTRGMLYQHLRELKTGGYLDDDFKITDAGRLALL